MRHANDIYRRLYYTNVKASTTKRNHHHVVFALYAFGIRLVNLIDDLVQIKTIANCNWKDNQKKYQRQNRKRQFSRR